MVRHASTLRSGLRGGRSALALSLSAVVVMTSLTLTAAPAAAAEAGPWEPKPYWAAPESFDPPEGEWVQPEADRSFMGEGEAGRAPAGTVASAPGVGELPWFSFEEFPLSGDTVAKVNIANGNLLVTSNDSTIAAPGYALRADRYYNGLSTNDGVFGGGWSSNASAEDMGLAIGATEVIFYGPNGTVRTFTEIGATGTYTSPVGLNATLTQTATSGNEAWTLEWNRTGEKWIYSIGGFLHRTVDRNGVGSRYEYFNGFMVRQFHDSGRAIRYNVNLAGEIDTIEDSPGRQVDYGYDSSGRLFEVVAPDGVETTYTYDSTGRLATITVPSAAAATVTTTFTYDSSHRVTDVTQTTLSGTWGAGSDAVTSFAYGAGSTDVTNANGKTASFVLDAEGRVETAIDALGNERSQTWTANSDVASATDALGAGGGVANTTAYTYDGNANVTNAQLPTGAAASAVYTAGVGCAGSGGTAFQVKCTTDAAGNESSFTYDSAGNLLEQTNETAGAVEFAYTYDTGSTSNPVCGGRKGQICTSEDGNGNITSFAYNTAGDLITATPPSPMGATTYTHDALGRVLTVTDGNGDVSSFTYDVRDRIIETEYDNGQTVTTTFHPNGLADATTDSNGALVQSFDYDAQGRITSQDGPNGGLQFRFNYDLVGNLTTHVAASGTTTYSYYDNNTLRTVAEPGGTCPSTGLPAAGSGCVTFAYDGNNAETQRAFPGGATVATTRDGAGRPTRITATDGADVLAVDIGYSYTDGTTDRATIQTRTSFKEEGITAGAVTAYGYDAYNRLASAVETAGTVMDASWAYAYDAAGNRTSQTRAGATGAAAGAITYGYNAANQLTSATGDITTWTYDAVGNQTQNGLTGQVASYGDRQQATSINAVSQGYFSAGNTNRLTSGSTSFTSSPLGLETRVGANMQTFLRTPAGAALGFRDVASHYYTADHLGSVVGVFSEDGVYLGGYSYSPYGETRAVGTAGAVESNMLRYTGGFRDAASGLYKLGARFYDPALGTFTQSDPTGQEANQYTYAAANPISNIDPTGTSWTAAIRIVNALLAGYSIAEVLGPGGNLLSFVVGDLVAYVCFALVTALGFATGGAGFFLTLGCGALGITAGNLVDDAFR